MAAAVHHLDLVRRVLTGLFGRPLPERWDDATAARRRAAPGGSG